MPPADLDGEKRAAAVRAAELVRDGMLLGIGTGTTASFFIEELGKLVAQGMRLSCVSSSERSSALARKAGVPVVDRHDRRLDLAVDGADEVAPDLSLIKGGGGSLLREKLVALAAERFVVIGDHTKVVPALGRFKLPVEVVKFLWPDTAQRLSSLGLSWELRGGPSTPFVTDEGHFILDTHVGGDGLIHDPQALGRELKHVVGVVEHGLFLGIAGACLIGEAAGVRVLGAL
ncbi:MAG: ribose-5-phosphate isomerase RpiA [Candidatus Dormibacteraeota bacterium]|nr:ribose-5-phosphate isomerase RpiA [Candidatus Dormibacteraeota bacterium]